MSKLMLIGGILSGTGLATGVAGLTIMGTSESESDLMRKKGKIEEEKLKVQGEIVKLEEEIEKLKQQKINLEQKKQNKEQRQQKITSLSQTIKTNIDSFLKNLNQNDKCYDLDLSKFLGNEEPLLKDEQWYKDLRKSYSGTTKYGKDCPERL